MNLSPRLTRRYYSSVPNQDETAAQLPTPPRQEAVAFYAWSSPQGRIYRHPQFRVNRSADLAPFLVFSPQKVYCSLGCEYRAPFLNSICGPTALAPSSFANSSRTTSTFPPTIVITGYVAGNSSCGTV